MSFSPHAAVMSSPGTIPSLLALFASTDDLTYPPRRLLLHTSMFSHHQTAPPPPPPPSAASPSSTRGAAPPAEPSLDANVIMILAVLLCALICAIGLNSVVRCALRCFSISISSSPPRPPRGTHPPVCAAGGGVKKAVLKSIPTLAYADIAAGEVMAPSWSDCAICLSEFKGGDRVRVLPGCNHGFHVRCVDRWLRGNATCPTCRGSCVVAAAAGEGACSGQRKAGLVPGCAGAQQEGDASAAAAASTPCPPPPPPPAPRPPASALSPLDREGTLVEGVLVEYLRRY